MPDKEIMLQVRQLDEQLPWNAVDAFSEAPNGASDHEALADALRQLAGDWRMLADLYERAKGKGFKTVYIEPLRHAAVQLDRVIKGLEQPRRASLGQLQPTSGPPAHASAGLDEPVHRFEVGPGATGTVCTAMVERDGAGDQCGRYASHPAHRLDGPTERPGLDALIAEASSEGAALGVTDEQRADSEKIMGDLRDHIASSYLALDFPGQASGDEVAAYLRGDADDIPGAPPLAPSSVRDMTIDPAVGPDFTGGAFTDAVRDGWAVGSAKRSTIEIGDQDVTEHVISDTLPDTYPPVPRTPPVPLLGQPGDAGSGYSPTYVPPGGVPLTYAELLTPVPYASLPPHLSHSQIETIADCPTKYRAQRLDSLPREGGPVTQIPQWALIGGNAFHAWVEAWERGVAEGQKMADPFTADDARYEWTTAFEAECAKIEATSPVPRSRWRASKQGAEGETWWNVNGPEMLRRYLAARPDETTADINNGPAIEVDIIADVPTAYGPIRYKAILDRVTVRAGDQSVRDAGQPSFPTLIIRDYKTGDRMPGDTSQLGEYAQVLRLIGVPPQVKILGTFFNARKGTWTPEVDLETAGWTAEWFTYVVTSGQAQRLALTQGPTPARPSSFCGGCSVRWACPIKGVKS